MNNASLHTHAYWYDLLQFCILQCTNKKHPVRKNVYFRDYSQIFNETYWFLAEDSGHICSKFRYNIWFRLQIIAILTRKCIFLSEQVINLATEFTRHKSDGLSCRPMKRYQRYMPKLTNIAELNTVLLTIRKDWPWSSSTRQSYKLNFAADFDRGLLQLVDTLNFV